MVRGGFDTTHQYDTFDRRTGKEVDSDADAQQQYNRARWYDPAQRRWLSQDPIGFGAGDVNLYRYVANEATGAVNPSGLEEEITLPDIGRRFPYELERPSWVNIPRGIKPWKVRGATPGTRTTAIHTAAALLRQMLAFYSGPWKDFRHGVAWVHFETKRRRWNCRISDKCSE